MDTTHHKGIKNEKTENRDYQRSQLVNVIMFFHEMRNADNGEISAVTLLTGIHLDTQTRKSCALPEATLETARGLVIVHELPWPV